MSSADFLEQFATDLKREAASTAARSAASPDDFWLAVAADNQQKAARDALRDLSREYARERGELLDIRFIGPKTNGSMMLDAFLKIADPLNKAWKATAFRLRHGVVEGRIGGDISDALNLRLAGIAPGSTHILLTGNSADDLTGDNLFRSTLTQTFRLLTSGGDGFYDAVDAVGARAARYFGEALKAIDAAGLAAQFSWDDRDTQFFWDGSTHELSRIQSLLADVIDPEVYEEVISGIVAGISDSGKLDVRTAAGKVRIRFPMDLLPAVQGLHITVHAAIRVQTSRFLDPASKREVLQHHMLSIESETGS